MNGNRPELMDGIGLILNGSGADIFADICTIIVNVCETWDLNSDLLLDIVKEAVNEHEESSKEEEEEEGENVERIDAADILALIEKFLKEREKDAEEERSDEEVQGIHTAKRKGNYRRILH